MKKTYLTSLAILLAFSAYSQEKSIAKVHYLFKHVHDSTERDNYMRDEVVTYLGTSTSYYTSYMSTRISQQLKEQISNPAFDGNLVINSTGSGIKESYLMDFATPNMVIVKKVGSADFNIDGPFPEQEWKIEDDTKVIGGYSCQKATTTFKGRNYEAWFSPDIPMPYGPWKLHGLPGLILAAKDEKGEVVFEYAGFDTLEGDDSLLIALSPTAKKTTEEEIKKLEKAFNDNPSAFMQSQRGGAGGTIFIPKTGASTSQATVYKSQGGIDSIDPSKIKSMTVNKDASIKISPVTNNPIELTK